MKIFIIDDDISFIKQVETTIKEFDSTIKISGKIDSVKKGLEWIQANGSPDLLLIDIKNTENIGFDIYEQIMLSVPVVFTTEYKDYIIRVFKQNSVEFLLKPLDKDDFIEILKKYQKGSKITSILNPNTDVIDSVMKMQNNELKKRFVIKDGNKVISLSVREVAYFKITKGGTCIQTKDKKSYKIDYSLDLLQKLIDPVLFFKINDELIINRTIISNAIVSENKEYELKMSRFSDEIFIVDKSKYQIFKNWFEQ